MPLLVADADIAEAAAIKIRVSQEKEVGLLRVTRPLFALPMAYWSEASEPSISKSPLLPSFAVAVFVFCDRIPRTLWLCAGIHPAAQAILASVMMIQKVVDWRSQPREANKKSLKHCNRIGRVVQIIVRAEQQ